MKKILLTFGFALLLAGCGHNKDTAEVAETLPTPEPVAAVDYTQFITYAAPEGMECQKRGSEAQGYFINCVNEEAGSSYRIGTLPYTETIDDIEKIVAGIMGAFSKDEEATTVQDTEILGYAAKKITAPVAMTTGEKATMISIVFEHDSIPFVINEMEINEENIDSEAFNAFVESIILAEIPEITEAVAKTSIIANKETGAEAEGVCADDRIDCGNGIEVGRNPGNNCEFDACPSDVIIETVTIDEDGNETPGEIVIEGGEIIKDTTNPNTE